MFVCLHLWADVAAPTSVYYTRKFVRCKAKKVPTSVLKCLNPVRNRRLTSNGVKLKSSFKGVYACIDAGCGSSKLVFYPLSSFVRDI